MAGILIYSFVYFVMTHSPQLCLRVASAIMSDIANGSSGADWVIAVGTLTGACATIAGFVIALIQLRQVRSEMAHDFDWRRKVKTDELARSYSSEIATLITYLLGVCKKSGAMEWVDLVSDTWLRHFDAEELAWIDDQIRDRLPSGCDGLAEAIDSSLEEMDLQDWEICHGKLPGDVRHAIDVELEPPKKKEAYLDEFHELQTETVNRLISFCNTIDFDLAVEDMIYPLVHDSFFIGVRVCYCRIAKANVVGSHQNAYSVQRVFIEWQARPEEHEVGRTGRYMQAGIWT